MSNGTILNRRLQIRQLFSIFLLYFLFRILYQSPDQFENNCKKEKQNDEANKRKYSIVFRISIHIIIYFLLHTFNKMSKTIFYETFAFTDIYLITIN